MSSKQAGSDQPVDTEGVHDKPKAPGRVITRASVTAPMLNYSYQGQFSQGQHIFRPQGFLSGDNQRHLLEVGVEAHDEVQDQLGVDWGEDPVEPGLV